MQEKSDTSKKENGDGNSGDQGAVLAGTAWRKVGGKVDGAEDKDKRDEMPNPVRDRQV